MENDILTTFDATPKYVLAYVYIGKELLCRATPSADTCVDTASTSRYRKAALLQVPDWGNARDQAWKSNNVEKNSLVVSCDIERLFKTAVIIV